MARLAWLPLVLVLSCAGEAPLEEPTSEPARRPAPIVEEPEHDCGYRFRHRHVRAEEPCAGLERLRERAGELGPPDALPPSEREAFELLASGGKLYRVYSVEGDRYESTAPVRALWTLLDSTRAEAAFARLYVDAADAGTASNAGLIGLRELESPFFGDAAAHFDHRELHLEFGPMYGGCLGTFNASVDDLGSSIDGLRLAELRSGELAWSDGFGLATVRGGK